MLSDPSYFPMEFRAWIKNYIEGSDIQLPASAVTGLGATVSGRTQLPPGMIVVYAGDSFGPDVLPCNGAAVSRKTYDMLFQSIGEKWGPGDSSTTFNVPDFRDRALYGAGSVVGLAATDTLALGSRGGPHHHHAVNIGTDKEQKHVHNAAAANFAQTNGTQVIVTLGSDFQFYAPNSFSAKTASAGDHSHTVQGDTGGGYGPDPGFAGINFCITTGSGSG